MINRSFKIKSPYLPERFLPPLAILDSKKLLQEPSFGINQSILSKFLTFSKSADCDSGLIALFVTRYQKREMYPDITKKKLSTVNFLAAL